MTSSSPISRVEEAPPSDDGRLPDGPASLTEAYRIDRARAIDSEVALDLCRFARALAAAGAWPAAARLIAKCDALREEIGESPDRGR
ncbi:MAG: hypothetical protein NVSMB8_04870 [Candidatus Limnocylindrales bacterium]